MLKQAIDIVEKAQDIPCAMFVQVFWSSQQVTRMKQMEPGTPLLPIAGIFQCMATEQCVQILQGDGETEP